LKHDEGCHKHLLVTALLSYVIKCVKPVKSRQSKPPIKVGKIAAISVHFRLPVSFLIVRSVVEQGQ